MRYTDVFIPGGYPRHTYNPRESLRLEEQLAEVKHNLCKLVTVTGHTKSGKTVLVRSSFPSEDSIWIDGGVVGCEEDFWCVVISQLQLFQMNSEGISIDSGIEVHGEGEAQVNFMITRGSAKVGGALAKNRGRERDRSQILTSRITAINGLRALKTPLVIDDFHYIPRDIQGSIVRALKPLIFDGHPVIIIAIPHRRYDVSVR